MDFPALGTALALAKKLVSGAADAATRANAAASAAEKATTKADNAAAAANTAAGGYASLNEYEIHDRHALNYLYTITQAELRDKEKRIATLEAQVSALRGS